MPKTRAQRRIDNNGSLARRNVTVLAGASSAVGAHTHDIYTTPDDVADLITTELTSLGLETAGTWTISGSVGYIDLVHAAGDSTLQILNSDGTRKAHVQIEGDLTVLGTLYSTEPLTGQEWAWSTNGYMYISANYADGPSVVQILNDSATYKASLFVEDKITTGGDISISGNIIGQTLQYPDTALYLEANNVLDSTVYVRNTDATAVAGLDVEGSVVIGGDLDVTGSVTLDEITITGAITQYVTITPDEFDQAYIYIPSADDTTLYIMNTLTGDASLNVQADITLGGNISMAESATVDGVDVSAHAAATEAHGATGAVVGTTNTQTLTNKTLAAPTVTGLMSAADGTFSGAVGIGGTSSGYQLRVVGTTNITGAATLASTINIAGTVTAQGDVTVGDDLTVTDTATVSGIFTAQSDVVLPYWEIDATTGVMQTTGNYAFVPPSATADYEGIRFMPSRGSIEAAYLSSSYFATETIVFEQTAVNAGDLIVAKSGGKLRTAATFTFKRYLVDDAGNQIVDNAGNAIVMHDAEVQTTIQLEHPPTGEHNLLMEGDQILIAGRPALSMWSYGTGMPFPPTRFFPAAVVSPSSTDMQVKLRCIVVSVSASDKNEYVVRVAPNQNVAYESLVFSAGSAVVSYGSSGEAYLSLQTRNRRAYMDIGTLPGTEWENNLTPFIRLGHIGGLVNVADPDDVGLVGGDITNGVDDYFKIAQDGITLHNGEHVIADANGVRRVLMSTAGLSIKLYEDPVETLADQDDIFSNDEIYQSAITWADDVDNPNSIYGAAYAYKNQSWAGAYDHVVGLEAIRTDDTTSAIARLRAGQAFITATTTRSTSTMRISAQNFLAVDSPSITITGNTAIVIDGGVVRFISIPTSSSGLPTGAIWNDSGTLKIVS